MVAQRHALTAAILANINGQFRIRKLIVLLTARRGSLPVVLYYQELLGPNARRRTTLYPNDEPEAWLPHDLSSGQRQITVSSS